MGSVTNIIDKRQRPYRWKRVNAVIESTSLNNTCPDSDNADEMSLEDQIIGIKRMGITIQEALEWSNGMPHSVTLYIYDEECEDI